MVTVDTILDDLAAGCTDVETYCDVEVLKSRLELEASKEEFRANLRTAMRP